MPITRVTTRCSVLYRVEVCKAAAEKYAEHTRHMHQGRANLQFPLVGFSRAFQGYSIVMTFASEEHGEHEEGDGEGEGEGEEGQREGEGGFSSSRTHSFITQLRSMTPTVTAYCI